MNIKNELLGYQQDAVKKLSQFKVGALFMEQGTGKSITAIKLVLDRVTKNKIDRAIWLCPCSAKSNIHDEILKQADDELRRIFLICGIETLSTSVRANSYLQNYAETYRCMLIVDESLLVKNHNALRTQHIQALADKTVYKLILNGTPISRNISDLYSQFHLLDWRILGYKSYWSFEANHVEKDEYGKFKKALNADFLAKKIAPYTVEIKKSDCMVLPQKKYRKIVFSLAPDQDRHYTDVADAFISLIDDRRPTTIYRLLSSLQAIVSGKRILYDKSDPTKPYKTEKFFDDVQNNPRYNAFKGLLQSDIGSEKAIVFCNYESEISDLCTVLGKKAVRFDGSVTMTARTEAVKQFKDGAQFFIANRSCAGYSLNLQFCRNIIYYSNNYDLGTRLQSEDRVHRFGQDKPVRIYDVCAENTIDEKIASSLASKENILDDLKSRIKNHNSIKLLIRGKVDDLIEEIWE